MVLDHTLSWKRNAQKLSITAYKNLQCIEEIQGQLMLVSQILRESIPLQYIYTFHLYIYNNASIAVISRSLKFML